MLTLLTIGLIIALAFTVARMQGSAPSPPPPTPSIKAVCAIAGDGGITGLITFVSVAGQKTKITGSVSGLSPGQHGMHIHELGDLSAGCNATGTHFNPYGQTHGMKMGRGRKHKEMGEKE
jgi:Cu-Zn family superoxide dismutase